MTTWQGVGWAKRYLDPEQQTRARGADGRHGVGVVVSDGTTWRRARRALRALPPALPLGRLRRALPSRPGGEGAAERRCGRSSPSRGSSARRSRSRATTSRASAGTRASSACGRTSRSSSASRRTRCSSRRRPPARAGHFGELTANAARAHGCVGCILDGNLRDIEGLRAIGFPVFYRDLSPLNGIGRWEMTASQQPIAIGGVTVQPGRHRLRRVRRDPRRAARRRGRGARARGGDRRRRGPRPRRGARRQLAVVELPAAWLHLGRASRPRSRARALAARRSAIREVFDAANRLPDAIRLEIGEPSFRTPRFVVDAALEAAARRAAPATRRTAATRACASRSRRRSSASTASRSTPTRSSSRRAR